MHTGDFVDGPVVKTLPSNARGIYTIAAKLLQSCPTLCDPIDSSPPGSPIYNQVYLLAYTAEVPMKPVPVGPKDI